MSEKQKEIITQYLQKHPHTDASDALDCIDYIRCFKCFDTGRYLIHELKHVSEREYYTIQSCSCTGYVRNIGKTETSNVTMDGRFLPYQSNYHNTISEPSPYYITLLANIYRNEYKK